MACLRILTVVAILGVAAGCGQDVYESRLAVTNEYFEHVNKLNENLGSPTTFDTITLRAPSQFSPLLDDEETENNETQPYYLGTELEGVVAAYQADVAVDVDGQDEARPAFIYVLSNEPIIKQLITKENTIEPTEFHQDLQNRLSGAFNVYIEPGKSGDGSEPNVPFSEMFPRPAPQGRLQYEPPKSYTVIRFRPPEPLSGFDIPMEYTLNMLTGNGDIQYAILTVVPEIARPAENLQERLRMMLETVSTRAGAAAPGGGPGNGNAPTGGGGLRF